MNGTQQGSEQSARLAHWGIAGTGDFDGDGKSDLLWHNGGTGATELWEMNGSPSRRRNCRRCR